MQQRPNGSIKEQKMKIQVCRGLMYATMVTWPNNEDKDMNSDLIYTYAARQNSSILQFKNKDKGMYGM